MNAIILAGGQNKRIGLKKAFLKLGGKKMIEKQLELLQPYFSEIIIVAKDKSEFKTLKTARVVEDAADGCSSLVGVYSGLFHSKAKHNFFFACDMPFLNESLINYMIGLCNGYDVVIPKFQGKHEALHAIYSKACLEPIENNLKRGDLKITNFFKALNVREITDKEVAQFDPKGLSFFNINTEADYEKAKSEYIF